MKVEKISIGATIPCMQYGNLTPTIELEDVSVEDGLEFAMTHIKKMFSKYSEKGELKENVVIEATGTKKSFNENIEIAFEPINHTYHYGDKKLISATEYIKKFYKPFDAETISAVSAKAWGVKQQDVKDLWDENGKLTSQLGNVIHKALETYDRFRELGQTINSNRELDGNYALPKHPIIKSAIEGFIAINKTTGEVIPEALITDIKNGFCGHADRILITDKKKKICKIQDYKINIDAEEIKSSDKPLAPFNTLPANKITKYQLQLSFYANMLEQSGWKVTGLDVFVLEDKWKHFALPVLKVI